MWRSRWFIIPAVMALQAVLMQAFCAALVAIGSNSGGWPSWSHARSLLTDPGWWFASAVTMAVVFAGQAIFLLPVREPAPAAKRGLSVQASLCVASLAIALLSLAMIWAVMELVDMWDGYWQYFYDRFSSELWGWMIVCGYVLIAWAVVTPLVLAFCKAQPREVLLGRLSARLFLGTIIEAAAIIPIDVMVRKRTSCYCTAGTYFALVLCGAVGLFALGPAVLLPLLARRRKRWHLGRCDCCGYDLQGLKAGQCPECGAGWKPRHPEPSPSPSKVTDRTSEEPPGESPPGPSRPDGGAAS